MELIYIVEQSPNYAFLGFLAPAFKWLGAKAIPAIGKFLGIGKATAGKVSGLSKLSSGLATGLGIAQGIGGLNSGQKSFQRNRDLMYEQFGLAKQMYDYQNAYNTPAMQMQRLKDAGLNPALMYGQGTTGNASGYPQAQTVAPYQHTPTDFQPLMNSITTASQKNLTDATAIGQGIDNAKKTATFSDDVLYAEANRQQAQAQKDKLVEEKLNIALQRQGIIADNEKKKIERDIQQIDKDFFKNYQLAPSDFGIWKLLKRMGVSATMIIDYLITGDIQSISKFFMGEQSYEEKTKNDQRGTIRNYRNQKSWKEKNY